MENFSLDDFLDGEDEQKPIKPSKESKSIKENNEAKETKKKTSKPNNDLDFEEFKKAMSDELEEKIRSLAIEVDENCVKAINQIVEKAVEGLSSKIISDVKSGLNLQRHIIQVNSDIEYITEHPVHYMFDDIMYALLSGMNCYLYGEAGSGKTELASDIAKAMKLPLHLLTSGDMIGIFGYNDISGKFHETPFTKAFKEGGILYISEFDSIDSSVALTLNTAIANKITTINGETVIANKDFYVICDGNTAGNGADFKYQGRRPLDGATINRFAFFFVDYDKNIELFLSNKNQELVDFIESFRKICNDRDIQVLATYRAIQTIVKLEDKFGIEKAIQVGLTKGMMADDLKAVQKSMALSNKYANAFKAMTRG